MEYADAAEIMMAIGNHDETNGVPVSLLSSALIIADKSDVHKSRVKDKLLNENTNIHDRVNYSVTDSNLTINDDKTEIRLSLSIDTEYGSIMDYFEIFLARMILCRKAAEKLGMSSKLVINEQTLI